MPEQSADDAGADILESKTGTPGIESRRRVDPAR